MYIWASLSIVLHTDTIVEYDGAGMSAWRRLGYLLMLVELEVYDAS
jgi:hypothetical protein